MCNQILTHPIYGSTVTIDKHRLSKELFNENNSYVTILPHYDEIMILYNDYINTDKLAKIFIASFPKSKTSIDLIDLPLKEFTFYYNRNYKTIDVIQNSDKLGISACYLYTDRIREYNFLQILKIDDNSIILDAKDGNISTRFGQDCNIQDSFLLQCRSHDGVLEYYLLINFNNNNYTYIYYDKLLEKLKKLIGRKHIKDMISPYFIYVEHDTIIFRVIVSHEGKLIIYICKLKNGDIESIIKKVILKYPPYYVLTYQPIVRCYRVGNLYVIQVSELLSGTHIFCKDIVTDEEVCAFEGSIMHSDNNLYIIEDRQKKYINVIISKLYNTIPEHEIEYNLREYLGGKKDTYGKLFKFIWT